MFTTTETYDVWWLIGILRRRMKLLLAVMTVIPILTALYVSALPKQYAAETGLLIEAERERVLGIETMISGMTGDSNTVQTEAEFIASRDIAIKTVQALGLMNDPEFNVLLDKDAARHWAERWLAALPEDLAAPLEPAVRWLAEGSRGTTDDGDLRRPPDELAMVTDVFLDKLSVEASRFARVITIRFRSTDP